MPGRNVLYTINRTIMELKRQCRFVVSGSISSINRTIMELKQEGVETEIELIAINRTIMELKRLHQGLALVQD